MNAVLKRVEVGKISRTLQTRLAFAQFKVDHGLEDLPFDTIEPRMKELQDTIDHSSSSSSSSSSDFLSPGSSSPYKRDRSFYKTQRCLVECLGKGSTIFSDQLQTMNIVRSSPSFRKRHGNLSVEDGNYRVYSWKRHCSSPLLSHITPVPSRNQVLSSPVMSRKHHHQNYFMTDSGPAIPSRLADSCRRNIVYNSRVDENDKEEGDLPLHPSDFRSSPPPLPCTPQPRHCNDILNCHRDLHAEKRGKNSGKDACSLNHHHHSFSTSPLFQRTPAPTHHPPSTPPPPTPTLPSSVMSTSRGTCDIFSSDTGPHTPLQAFDFSDFVNITPSPSRSSWAVSPRIIISRKT